MKKHHNNNNVPSFISHRDRASLLQYITTMLSRYFLLICVLLVTIVASVPEDWDEVSIKFFHVAFFELENQAIHECYG